MLPCRFGQLRHGSSKGASIGYRFVGDARRLQLPHALGDGWREHRLDKRLSERSVERQIDLRDPGSSCKAALIFDRVATHSPDIVQRPLLALHDSLARY